MNNGLWDGAELTGGEQAHTLTVDELPPHSHAISVGPIGNSTTIVNGYFVANTYTESSHQGATLFVGQGVAHNNMQPYITTYMWKRVS